MGTAADEVVALLKGKTQPYPKMTDNANCTYPPTDGDMGFVRIRP